MSFMFCLQCVLITTVLYIHFHYACSLINFIKNRYTVEEICERYPNMYNSLLEKFDNDLDKMREGIIAGRHRNILVGSAMIFLSFSIQTSIVIYFTGGI